ncbi:MAG: family 16 glycoside hydrolase, partial [Thermoguttaceae bacterium]
EGQGEGNTVIKPTKTPPLRSVAKWNKCEITCIKDKLVVKINDVVVNQATGLRGQAGKICLRNQNTAIEFRNIRLVPMP